MENEFGFLHGMYIAGILSGVPLLVSMVVGLLVSIFQAATQIQEQTLTLICKLTSVSIVLFFFGPWMLDLLQNYFIAACESIPYLSKAF